MHNQPHHPTTAGEKSRVAVRVTWIGALIDGVLGLTKIVIGWLFFSHALIADGIHSLTDLLTDFMVVAVVKISGAEPDARHPYGHERFETLGAAFLGFLLVAVAGAMGYESALRLLDARPAMTPGWPALAAALVSIIAKEWIFRYTRAAGQRLGSNLLIANAWHSRTDAWSSLVVFAGVGGAMLGILWLDSLAALGVAVFIAWIGWDLIRKSLRELVDTAIEPAELEALIAAAMAVEGIVDVHSFRSRRMGAKILLELHLQVAPYLSASESHQIGDRVMLKLMKEFDSIGHIIYHIDTENDDDIRPGMPLPARSEVTRLIDEALREAGGRGYGHLTLHYLQDRVEVEIFLEGGAWAADEREALHAAIHRALSCFDWFGRLKLWYPG